ncbi:MAG: glycosyltransferase family 39 protein, partial [Chloroflexi bacterium]|nr:glycosyltransferase family 39 protein [Chloroflexota bacterium]
MSLMTPEAREIKASPKTAFWIAVLLLLLGWGLRLCALNEVPPGWRDDELINIHVISGKPLTGQFPLYFTDASGHEPLYHYLHAAVHAALGFNVLSGHILSGAFGTLTLALTYALARRLFSGQTVALIATAAMATSFWSLMYSRTGIRHMSLPPFAVAIMWLLPIWHCLCS